MKVTVFEFDKHFGRYGDAFVEYDYKEPLKNVQEKFAAQCFHVAVADPPFLSQECFQLTCQTVSYLSKDKMVVFTGATMAELAKSSLNLEEHPTLVPRHAKQLMNELKCFTNFVNAKGFD